MSGLTGVGGGVFLAPLLIVVGWATPRRAAGLSAPFILANSFAALVGVLATGQHVAAGTGAHAGAALFGAIAGTAVGLRWLSQAACSTTQASSLRSTPACWPMRTARPRPGLVAW